MSGRPEGGVVAFPQADAGWRRLLLPRKTADAGLENDLAPESQWPLPMPLPKSNEPQALLGLP